MTNQRQDIHPIRFFVSSKCRVILSCLLTTALATGCISSEQTIKDVSLEEPRSTGGIMIRDPKDDTLEQLVEKLQSARENRDHNPPADQNTSNTIIEVDLKSVQRSADLESVEHHSWATGMGYLVNLPRLSRIELSELANDLALSLRTGYGYENAVPHIAAATPLLPEGVVGDRLLARESEDGYRVLRFGYWQYKSRGPRFCIYGAIVRDDDDLAQNPDTPAAKSLLEQSLTTIEELHKSLTAVDLESKIIQLSYIDIAGAIAALRGFGIETIDSGGTMPQDIEFKRLPLVVALPSPPPESTGLVGKSEFGKSQFGTTVAPAVSEDLKAEMIATPTTRLVVLFHPAHPEQFGRVQQLIDEAIDRPARQIYIESMIIEITEGGLKQLGVEWEFQDGKFNIAGGSLSTNLQESLADIGETIFLTGDSSQDLSSEWLFNIRALLVDGQAKILSRPSVLALNNRQATIRIGEDIPIATSQEGISGDSSKISFNFNYVPLGILLNIRPRASADGREISMMIDITVSARKPESDLEIRDEDGKLLASAPTVTTRRVQTYARIQNNTPFIIGGLVSRNDIRVYEKVPFLGDLPVIGALFRSESSRQVRNEVIIVLTPYVLPEKLHLSRALPKAGEYFDDRDSELFRESCRIQSEDITDVRFLYRNKRFERYRKLALEAIRQDFRLAEEEPFYSFAEDRLPGERVLVNRIIYNTANRLGLGSAVNEDLIFLLTDHDSGGYDADYLDMILTKLGGGADSSSFFTNHPNKALAISFADLYETTGGQSLISDPIPRLSVVDCADRKAWARLLWELNQPGEDGPQRYTVLIHQEEDVLRLQQAILTKHILELNGGGGPEASLLKFIPGRIIEIPDIKPEAAHVIDADVARYFFHSSKHFYAATLQEIESTLSELNQEFHRPELQYLLGNKRQTALE